MLFKYLLFFILSNQVSFSLFFFLQLIVCLILNNLLILFYQLFLYIKAKAKFFLDIIFLKYSKLGDPSGIY
ncbi:hypothetical protein AN286_04595 [Aliarcobacter cryaerophilus ATCC 43158]|uniref:Membrane protein n=1 Tax=Aliarcobacter cryaerophilus ATCC 43158 TaxID=1032070 RepID=A0AAD0X894_9BACT|nr:putative membrane protein [Aliarcobacter cryaerophilus ATCC 43158]PRM96577.1 hypothetical protein CJ667_07605 [Aliarcobacter cryaerophilus]QCZ23703.1 hypothetical protein AN286_04595 [Aliarcobacter cryaerophilus ATCC 43158]